MIYQKYSTLCQPPAVLLITEKMLRTPSRGSLLLAKSPRLYYPFGNTRIRNVLKDYNFDINCENTDTTKVMWCHMNAQCFVHVLCMNCQLHTKLDCFILQILFLGCGDLRNAFQATTTENAKHVHIHLNDALPAILARNIVVLKIISANDFNPYDIGDFAFIWDVWYNAEWSEITQKRFLLVLNDLLNETLPQNILIPKASHLEKLKEVWSSWHSTASKDRVKSELLMKKIQKERYHPLTNNLNSKQILGFHLT